MPVPQDPQELGGVGREEAASPGKHTDHRNQQNKAASICVLSLQQCPGGAGAAEGGMGAPEPSWPSNPSRWDLGTNCAQGEREGKQTETN